MTGARYNVGAIALLHILLMEELSEFLAEWNVSDHNRDYSEIQKEWYDVLGVLFLLMEAIGSDRFWLLDKYEDKRNHLKHICDIGVESQITFLLTAAIKIVSKSYRFGPFSLPEGKCIELKRYPNGIPLPALADLQELLITIRISLQHMDLADPKECFYLHCHGDSTSVHMVAIAKKIEKVKRYHSDVFGTV